MGREMGRDIGFNKREERTERWAELGSL